VTSAERLPSLPEVQVIGETVPGYAVDGWLGLGAPKGTPDAIIEKLNAALGVGIADPQIKERLINLGFVPAAMTPGQFGAFIADETAKWAKVVKFAGVKLD
jgi:tripartite-type tricarboxylate transporter receptor subunit TctC